MTWDQRAIFALVGGWEPCHEPPPRVDIVGLYGTGVFFKEPNPTGCRPVLQYCEATQTRWMNTK